MEAASEGNLIKLQKTQSHFSVGMDGEGANENIDSEVKELFVGK